MFLTHVLLHLAEIIKFLIVGECRSGWHRTIVLFSAPVLWARKNVSMCFFKCFFFVFLCALFLKVLINRLIMANNETSREVQGSSQRGGPLASLFIFRAYFF